MTRQYLIKGLIALQFITIQCSSAADTKDIMKTSRPYTPKIFSSLYDPGQRTYDMLDKVYEKAKDGDIISAAQMNMFNLLGVENNPNLKKVETKAINLIQNGAAAAHTVLGFLLRHNLTSQTYPITDDTKLETQGQSLPVSDLDHFSIAAEAGDPLAQIIVADNHYVNRRCQKALDLYRRAALQALPNIPESEISLVKYAPRIDGTRTFQLPSEEELVYLEHMAINGDPDAAAEVASVYMSGHLGLPYDIEKAQKYLRVSIEAGNSWAMSHMAYIHVDKKVTNPDYAYAKSLLEEALKLNETSAHAAYATFYTEGLADTPKNVTVALQHLEKGIAAGYVEALYGMGQLIATHYSSSRDSEAAEYWSLASTAGHVYATWYTAEFLSNEVLRDSHLIGGNKTNMSDILCEVSLPSYREVALAGEWSEILFAAYEDFTQGRFNAAAIKYMLLSDMGYEAALINLGQILQNDQVSLYYALDERNYQERLAWELASNSSIAVGSLELAHHYYYGTGGLKSNFSKAANLYHRAMSKSAEAAFNLAYLYEWGEGVKQDVPKAARLYNIAANSTSAAWFPSMLAISRLEAFHFTKNAIGFDMHQSDFPSITKTLINFGQLLNSYELMLSCVIVILWKVRHV